MIIDTTQTAFEHRIRLQRESDIRDIQEQLAQTANDPNLTIVTQQWWPCHPTMKEIDDAYGAMTISMNERANRPEIDWENGPCDEGCSCHIAPPCSYCTDRSECPLCGEVVLSEWLVEYNDDWICEDCVPVQAELY